MQIWWQTLILSMIFIERIALSAYEKHFPNKRVKVNKHKHKLSPWITTGLIKSIEFRDKLYKWLKSCPQDNPDGI